MRLGGKIGNRILVELKNDLRPGISTGEIDKSAEKLILSAGAKASFKGFRGYPASICVSINDEVVHGLPSERRLKEGDIVGLDLGVYYLGFHTDTAITCPVGKISQEARSLIDITSESLNKGIQEAQPGKFLGDVQAKIQEVIEAAGFGVIRGLSGHGIGRALQEDPVIPNFGRPGTGPCLEVGMTLAIEPMVAAGDGRTKILEDGWTIATLDGSLSAHFEHTIAITESGPEILT